MSRIIPVEIFGDEELIELGGPRIRRGGRRGGGGRGGRSKTSASRRPEKREEEEQERPRGGGGRRQDEDEEQPRRRQDEDEEQERPRRRSEEFAGVRRGAAPSWFSGDDFFGGEPARGGRGGGGGFKIPKWLQRKPAATAAGPNLAIVAKPGSQIQAGVMQLKPGLYLVGEVPKTAADPAFGFLPFLVPMMVRGAQRALSNNAVQQDGKPARGFALFRKRDRDENPEATTAIARRSDAAEAPRWVDEDDAAEVGFGWMER